MTGYDRFMTALRREQPDRVPLWELIVNEPTLSTWGATTLEDFTEQENLDAVTIFEDMPLRPLGSDETAALSWQGQTMKTEGGQQVVDQWGVVWATTYFGIPYPVAGPIGSAEDLKSYRPPDPDADGRLESLQSAVKRFKNKRAIVFLTHDGFEFPHYMRGGMDNLLIDYLTDPDLAHDLAEIVIDYKIRLMRRAIAVGADVIVSGDDYAGREAPFMSPKHFETFVLPYLKRSIDEAHEHGIPYIKHTDGNVWSIMDMMVEAGIDAIDPLEPLADMDVGRMKREYGDWVAVIGNVDCTELLPNGSLEDVEDAVKETIAKAAPGGGYILASSNSIHPAVKPENYRRMVEAARQWGTYPIDPDLVENWSRKSYIAKWTASG